MINKLIPSERIL